MIKFIHFVYFLPLGLTIKLNFNISKVAYLKDFKYFEYCNSLIVGASI